MVSKLIYVVSNGLVVLQKHTTWTVVKASIPSYKMLQIKWDPFFVHLGESENVKMLNFEKKNIDVHLIYQPCGITRLDPKPSGKLSQ